MNLVRLIAHLIINFFMIYVLAFQPNLLTLFYILSIHRLMLILRLYNLQPSLRMIANYGHVLMVGYQFELYLH
jgi:hypothetical protein